ncbi:MAG: S-layer homology domain-containing protein, partial [Faecousia sp.]
GEAANVTLSLEGENTFTAGMGSPCIIVANESTLTIAGEGSVTARGGNLNGSAGISAQSGNIIISGGTVNAIGGTVEDVTGESTGIFAREADILISGGKVNATGADVAVDGSRSIGINVASGSITISGGEVNATGGAVTGNKCWSRGIHTGGDTVINGGTVEAAGGAATGKDGQSCGIYADGDLTVSGTADVTARGGDIPLADNAGEEATAMVRESFGIVSYAGDVTINGGTLEAAGGNNAAWSMGIYSWGDGKVAVNGGTLNAAGGDAKYTASESSAISYGISGSGLTVNGGTVTVTGGDVYGSYPECLGITVGQVTITGGTVNAEGGAATGKWGGATSCAISSSGKIEISGGVVTAEGGNATFVPETEHDPSDSASSFGIRSWRAIEISGGTVVAAGGAADTESNGMKLQYDYYPDYGEFDGGYLTISGGEVNATGGAADDSLGICARVYRYDLDIILAVEPGTIAITGGRMTARTLAGEGAEVRMALNAAPSLPDAYWWRTAEAAAFTASTTPYTFSYNHTYVQLITGISFADVTANDYYYDAVQWAVNNGITNGTSETTFSPDAPCTRAHAVTFLWRAAGSPAPKSSEMPFADVVKGSYYEQAVLWAVENGITNGTSAATFSPDAICTRAQAVTFLWRAQGMPAAGMTNPFTDVASGEYYYNAVLWAVENGITNGTSATTFSPDADCTRAQNVTFLYRCLSK